MTEPTEDRPWYGKETHGGFVLIVVQGVQQSNITDLVIREGKPVINYGCGWVDDDSSGRK